MNYGAPSGSNLHTQSQFIPPPAYQSQQKSAVRFNPQQSPKLTGVSQFSKNVSSQPLVSFFKNNDSNYNNLYYCIKINYTFYNF